MAVSVSIIVAEIESNGIATGGIRDKYCRVFVVPNAIAEDRAKAIAGVVLPCQRDAVITVVVNIIIVYEVILIALSLAEGNTIAGVVVALIPLDYTVPHLAEPDSRTTISISLIFLNEEIRDKVLAVYARSTVVSRDAAFE